MDYRIPLFDLNFGPEEQQAVLATIRSRWISTGPRTAEFERRFAEMLGARHAVAVANCTCALHLAMVLNGIGPGDEVIVPSLTFVATVNAVRYVGATPVFCDIVSEEDLTIDPEMTARLVTPRTKAIVVMHYGGFPCRMDEIMALAQRHKLSVIEDAAHAPLSECDGRKLGTIGTVGCFSFFSNKNISTGEGGMLVTDDDALAARARLLRSHGMTSLSYERAKGHATSYDVVELGFNYRMDDIRAAIGLAQLEKLQHDIERRAQVRQWYLEEMKEISGLIIPFAGHTGRVSNYIFGVVLRRTDAARRDAVREKLHAAGIQTSMHYPAVHRFSIYRQCAAKLPQTERVADSLITLPMYANLGEADVQFIARSLAEARA
jgi:dTDP-4-amino-4,6-dideoxygalactose transaminase